MKLENLKGSVMESFELKSFLMKLSILKKMNFT